MAAHPQQEEVGPEPTPDEPARTVKNPFPSQMTVPGVEGQDVTVDLAVVDGVVYAPGLDEAPITAQVRQYVTQYCAAWSTSVLTTGQMERAVESPRRAMVVFTEPQMHAMLGLAGDERLVRVFVHDPSGQVSFLVESPRLPPMPFWGSDPLTITLPVAAYYDPASGR